MLWWLWVGFALVAGIYALAGFGGGSAYTALLALTGLDFRLIPIVALACNIVVVASGAILFLRRGHSSLRQALPLLSPAIPAAYLGGLLPLDEQAYFLLLALALGAAAMALLWPRPRKTEAEAESVTTVSPQGGGLTLGLLGSGVGLLSGMVGIGGGVFLAPMLYAMGRFSARRIAGLCSLFILVSSSAGLAAHLLKSFDPVLFGTHWPYLTLVLAVLVGGQVGSRLASGRLPEVWLRRATALIVLVVAVRLGAQVWSSPAL